MPTVTRDDDELVRALSKKSKLTVKYIRAIAEELNWDEYAIRDRIQVEMLEGDASIWGWRAISG